VTEHNPEEEPLARGDYCRRVEAYLCQKNEGHLVRIVGPAFEMVSHWAVMGVPLRIAFRGIDRYVTRYYAKGPRRRPVRIEFCEADVLDVFDEWRRAVGITPRPADEAVTAGPGEPSDTTPRRGPPLTTHLDRVLLKLSSFLAGTGAPASLRDLVQRDVREIDRMRREARGLRGPAREQVIVRLREIDDGMMAEVRHSAPADVVELLRTTAEAELKGFRSRMPDTAWTAAVESAIRQALRERLGLPAIALE
jgi:hypothetical protein